MVRQFQDVADVNNRFVSFFRHGKLDSVLVIHPYGRNARLVAFQDLITQGWKQEQVFNLVCVFDKVNAFSVTLYDVGLKVVFLVPLSRFV